MGRVAQERRRVERSRTRRRQGQGLRPLRRDWTVYMLTCRDGSLYTGVAKDVDARVEVHNSGRGAAYTRSRRPVKVCWKKHGFTRSEALSREAAIKRLPRSQKQLLARS
ncbi:MAG: GIY-YIG nuclease family protein [Elusimicrobia bacterium]|nr:GIY-YIG nuclease family protein [Elusimicrobiota bacterium]